MLTRLLRYAAAAIALAIAAITLHPADANAFCRMTSSGRDCELCEDDDPSAGCMYLEWKRRCMQYGINTSGARDFDDMALDRIVSDSFQQWLNVTCDGVPIELQASLMDDRSQCSTAQFNTDDGNINTIVFTSDWDELGYDPAAYALTTVWHRRTTGEILDADIEVNETRGTYTECPAPEGCTDGQIDLQNVITHEAGHFFGMGHSETNFAAMFAESPAGEVSKRLLRADDAEGLCTIYPTGSLPDTCDPTPNGGLLLTCVEPGCGCSVPGPNRDPAGAVLSFLVLGLLGFRRLRA